MRSGGLVWRHISYLRGAEKILVAGADLSPVCCDAGL